MKASCLCGGVTYEIAGPILRPRYCHCSHCRKFSGTASAAWGLIETAHFTLGPSSARVTKYNSGHGLRVFCAVCGSPLWYEPSGRPQWRGVPLGAIDTPGVPAPEMHVWIKSNADWAPVRDELPQHATHP